MSTLKSNLWKLYGYKLFSSFWLIAPILIPFYQSNGLSGTQVFVIQAIYALALLIFEIPSGYLSDVIGRKKTLIIGAVLLPIGVSVYAFSSTFIAFAVAEIIVAIAGSMHSGTDSAMLYDTLLQLKQKSKYKKTEGTANFFNSIGTASASLLGGLLALITLRTPFYFNIATAIVLIPLAVSLIEPKRKKSISKNHFQEILKIVKYTLNHSKIRSLAIYFSLLLSTGIIGVWSYYMYYGELGLSVGLYGILFAVTGLAIAFGSKHADFIENKIGRKNSLYLLLLISPIFLALGFIKSIFLIPFIFVNAFLWGFSTPLFMEYINQLIKSDIRATVLSVNSMIGRSAYVILAPIFGKLIDVYSLSFALKSMGLFFLVMGIISLILLNKNKVI